MQMPEYVEECRLYFGNLILLLDSLYVKQYTFLGYYIFSLKLIILMLNSISSAITDLKQCIVLFFIYYLLFLEIEKIEL